MLFFRYIRYIGAAIRWVLSGRKVDFHGREWKENMESHLMEDCVIGIGILFLISISLQMLKASPNHNADSNPDIVSNEQTMYDTGFTNKAEAKNLKVKGLKEGKWIEYLDDSDKITKDTNAPYYMLTIYKTDTACGTIREYYKSGKLYAVAPYDSYCYLNGVAKEYFENGTLKEEAPYADNKRNGPEKEYYPSGKLKRVTPYDTNGVLNGSEKIYYESGILESEAPFRNDTQTGLEKQYYEDGKIQEEDPYVNAKLNGIIKVYFEDGKLSRELTCESDSIVLVKEYDENGKQIKSK